MKAETAQQSHDGGSPNPGRGGAETRTAAAIRLADLLELTKVRITTMVVVTAAAGFLLGASSPFPYLLLLHALVGTGLLSAGASTLNHVLEQGTDAKMRRTAQRPLPGGRIDSGFALLFGVALILTGLVYLVIFVNLLTALIGAITVASYLFLYTPLKRVTSLATVVGAIPGALPPMMGWTALHDRIDPGAWVVFGILFLWQLPHFLAIAWMFREDYARGGFPVLTVLDETGEKTARQMILWCAALLPVSLLPTLLGLTGAAYFVGALILGVVFLFYCFAFARRPSAAAARKLLLVSVVYLPAILGSMLLDRLAG